MRDIIIPPPEVALRDHLEKLGNGIMKMGCVREYHYHRCQGEVAATLPFNYPLHLLSFFFFFFLFSFSSRCDVTNRIEERSLLYAAALNDEKKKRREREKRDSQ